MIRIGHKYVLLELLIHRKNPNYYGTYAINSRVFLRFKGEKSFFNSFIGTVCLGNLNTDDVNII